MKWIQFFTPAESIDFNRTKSIIDRSRADDITILDVRQPKEYRQSHIPGATLLPLPELGDRLTELDPEKPVLVYCAIGGRSRVAAQMLSGKGFKKVYNVAGGIKAWQAQTAVGPQDLGVQLFTDTDDPEEILKVAFSLELGLEDFYGEMAGKAENPKVKSLFNQLSRIEIKHQESISAAYQALGHPDMDRDKLAALATVDAMEGGLTTAQYLELFSPDLRSEVDVISLAMSIEAQALDLYQRLGARVPLEVSRAVVLKIADEEKEHLRSLGRLMDQLEQHPLE